MLLAIDIGNSNTSIGIVQDGSILLEAFIPTSTIANMGAFTQEVETILRDGNFPAGSVREGIVSSVVPPALETVCAGIQNIIGKPPMVVGPWMKTGLVMQVDEPERVGSDRIVVAVAALEHYQPPLLLIDMGTATTIDAVEAGNLYLGGCILPGVQIAANALHDKTAQLPAVKLERPRRVIGKNTMECMQSGAVYGTAALIDGMLDRMEEELGHPATTVATGGFSRFILPLCRKKILLDEHLLLRGLYILYEKNC